MNNRLLAAFASMVLFSLPTVASGQHIVAHRGASHSAPENTLAAFRLAWDEGADGVEGDFRLTADGHIVCVHDADTVRVAGEKRIVAESTLAELRRLDVGSWKHPRYAKERIPTLAEVLQLIPQGKLFFIELKPGPEIVPPLARVLDESDVSGEQLVIIAFDEQVVRLCKQKLPNIKTHWLTGYKESDNGSWTPTTAEVAESLRSTGAEGLGSQANLAAFGTAALARLRDEGLAEFHVWTVDEVNVARFYIDQGAWSITTNRPGWLRKQLGAAIR